MNDNDGDDDDDDDDDAPAPTAATANALCSREVNPANLRQSHPLLQLASLLIRQSVSFVV
jgi:hypothetical protein